MAFLASPEKQQDQEMIKTQFQLTVNLEASSKSFHLKRLPGHLQTLITARILTKSSENEVPPRVIQQPEKNSYKI